MPSLEQRYVGCLLGAAAGDARGAAAGGQAPALAGETTQLMLFTAEGLLRAHNRAVAGQPADPISHLHRALLRWLDTQRQEAPPPRTDGWLSSVPELYARRARSTVVVQALRTGLCGRVDQPINNARDAGPLARVVPVALSAGWDPFALGRGAAAITHGHPDVGLGAGTVASLLQSLVLGTPVEVAVDQTWGEIEAHPNSRPLLAAMEQALDAADLGDPTPAQAAAFGDGRDPASALAIALYAAVAAGTLREALELATARSAAPEWTGALTGALIGARLGAPDAGRAAAVGLAPVAVRLAEDLFAHFAAPGFEPTEADWNRYPG